MADTHSLDPDTTSISPTQAQPRATQNAGITSGLSGPLGEFLGGTVGIGAAVTRGTANVFSSQAGPALLLVLGGFALAIFARRRR